MHNVTIRDILGTGVSLGPLDKCDKVVYRLGGGAGALVTKTKFLIGTAVRGIQQIESDVKWSAF